MMPTMQSLGIELRYAIIVERTSMSGRSRSSKPGVSMRVMVRSGFVAYSKPEHVTVPVSQGLARPRCLRTDGAQEVARLHGRRLSPTITGAPVTFAIKEDFPAPVPPIKSIALTDGFLGSLLLAKGLEYVL